MQTAPNTPATQKVADRLCSLCTSGDWRGAIVELYADDARHVEAMEWPGGPYKRVMQGKDTLLQMSDHFTKTTTVHECTVGKPIVNDDQFIVEMTMDATHSEGPMAGHRMKMSEQCLYTVKNGKITEAKFFYGM